MLMCLYVVGHFLIHCILGSKHLVGAFILEAPVIPGNIVGTVGLFLFAHPVDFRFQFSLVC